jgi:hypothetical protein
VWCAVCCAVGLTPAGWHCHSSAAPWQGDVIQQLPGCRRCIQLLLRLQGELGSSLLC